MQRIKDLGMIPLAQENLEDSIISLAVALGYAPEKIKIIWRTPTYPDYQWTIRGDLESRFGVGFKDKVVSALLNLKDKELLASFPRKSFVPATNADYEPILRTGQAIGLMD